MDRETLEGMRRFFSPTHIAVVGASTKNHWFANVVKNARSIGFEGGIHPINPNAAEVAGIKAFPSIGELPDRLIDFGVIIVNAKLVLKSIEE
ncbi:MAG TPA: CoA-binding protein, partial [Deltaproteobacteria bacterium]|nr:CoA-binding protein [Deltaproteobacteria bacterium]